MLTVQFRLQVYKKEYTFMSMGMNTLAIQFLENQLTYDLGQYIAR